MRMMLKVNIPVDKGNAGIRDGSLPVTFKKILDDLKPEAAYFLEDNGERTALLFFDMQKASDIPAVAEPWFLAFDAKLTIRPVMTLQDLQEAGPGIEKAVKSFGK